MAQLPVYQQQREAHSQGLQTHAGAADFGVQTGAALQDLARGVSDVGTTAHNQAEEDNRLWMLNAQTQSEKFWVENFGKMQADAEANGKMGSFVDDFKSAYDKHIDATVKDAPNTRTFQELQLRLQQQGIGMLRQAVHSVASYRAKQAVANMQSVVDGQISIANMTGNFEQAKDFIKQTMGEVTGQLTPDQASGLHQETMAKVDKAQVEFVGGQSPDDAIEGIKSGTLGQNMAPDAKAQVVADMQQKKIATLGVAATNAAGVVKGLGSKLAQGAAVSDDEINAAKSAYIGFKTTGVSAKTRNNQAVKAATDFNLMVQQSRTIGVATTEMFGKDPETLTQFVSKVHEATGDTPLYKGIAGVANNLIKQINNDPAMYSMNDKTVRQLWDTAQGLANGGDPQKYTAAMNNVVTAMLDTQKRAGVPADKLSVLSAGQVNAYRKKMLDNPEAARDVYKQVSNAYGDQGQGIALRQLFGRPHVDELTGEKTQELPPIYDLIKLNPEDKQLWDAANTKLPHADAENKKEINKALGNNENFNSYALSLTSKGGAGAEDLQRKRDGIASLASYYVQTGSVNSYKDGVDKAVSTTLGNNYQFADAGGGKKITLPKEIAPTQEAAKNINTTLGAIKLSIGSKDNPYSISIPDSDHGDIANYYSRVARDGIWVREGDSVALKIKNNDGSYAPVMTQHGINVQADNVKGQMKMVPLRIKLNDLKDFTESINGETDKAAKGYYKEQMGKAINAGDAPLSLSQGLNTDNQAFDRGQFYTNKLLEKFGTSRTREVQFKAPEIQVSGELMDMLRGAK